MARSKYELLPTFTAELKEIRENGISKELLYNIIQKHLPNAIYNKKLYERYMAIEEGVPIFDRHPRFEKERQINNRVNNDFFSEIVDFKVGYIVGEPIAYSYSDTKEAEEVTGGVKEVEKANKTLTDFITRNNMRGVDMEITKNATIYGYSGRLFYVDTEGKERVMPVHGYETIVLSDTDIAEPEYAIRYFSSVDINGAESWTAEFYDNRNVTIYKGNSLMDLEEIETKEHLFNYCPLQGVANNKECLGDGEKVLALIDNYDKTVSDNSNEIESFAHAIMITSLLGDNVEEELSKANETGIINIPPIGTQAVNEPAKWLTKNINDTFTENHIKHLEDNIYRFSKTPNLSDETFGNASGVSLKFKLHGLETKCSTYEASFMSAAVYMWKVLCSAWTKKGIKADPLQFVMEFKRNFPLDTLSEAQTAQIYKNIGLPDKWIWGQLSGIDDVAYIAELKENEVSDITSMYEQTPTETEDEETEKSEKTEEEES